MTCDKVLRQLPSLANLHARKNIAFIGPEGIGKTHLAQAYGNRCCTLGFKTYYLKATELKAKLEKAIAENRAESVVNFMVKPSCLIIGEIGRRKFDGECTNLFFDTVDAATRKRAQTRSFSPATRRRSNGETSSLAATHCCALWTGCSTGHRSS